MAPTQPVMASNKPDFARFPLNNGIELYVHSTPKFKTTTVNAFVMQDLTRENATRGSLLASILRRGTEEFPTTEGLNRHLEELYGADLKTDILKKGETQIIQFHLELPNERFLPGQENLLEQGLRILLQVMARPVTQGGGLAGNYVNQEKENLRRRIEGLRNDKRQCAVARCFQEMCRGERFGIYKYGLVEDIAPLEPADLLEYHRRLLSENPIQIYLVGAVEPEAARDLAASVFDFPREGRVTLTPTEVRREAGEVRKVVEAQDVSQGKLCLGLRTGISRRDDGWYALAVANGILGAYPHSKLFQNVREKASLAYYAYSNLEGTKGLGIISAGIEFTDYQRTLDIIEKQIEDLKAGQVSNQDYETTIKAMVNDLRASEDNPAQKINLYLDGVLNGRPEGLSEKIERIRSVTLDQAVEAAGNLQLDTIYFLTNQEGGR